MAKNTGRGSRVAAQRQTLPPANMWLKRDTSAGRFIEAKTRGGAFPRPPRKSPLERFLDLFV